MTSKKAKDAEGIDYSELVEFIAEQIDGVKGEVGGLKNEIEGIKDEIGGLKEIIKTKADKSDINDVLTRINQTAITRTTIGPSNLKCGTMLKRTTNGSPKPRQKSELKWKNNNLIFKG